MRMSVTALQHEHAIIRQALDVLSEASGIEDGRHRPELGELLSFLREFLDRFHCGKEEQVFLPLAMKELPGLREGADGIAEAHEDARGLLLRAERALGGEDELRETMGELARMLCAHMRAEEEGVLREVDERLSLAMDERMGLAFQVYDSEFGEDYHQLSRMRVNDIRHRLLGPGHFDRCIY